MEKLEKDDQTVIKLSKKYTFEAKEYEEIDLSNLENMTASEMIKAENAAKRVNRAEALPELSMEYACNMAYYATKIPVEFFYMLNMSDARKVKTVIQSFFS